MIINIERFGCCRHAVSGRLYIDGQLVCHTLENAGCCLPEGEYPLQRDSSLPLPYYICSEPVGKEGKEYIKKTARVALAMGNGIFGQRRYCILLGTCLHLGFLIRSQSSYEQVTARIRMQMVRHHEVRVVFTRRADFVDADKMVGPDEN